MSLHIFLHEDSPFIAGRHSGTSLRNAAFLRLLNPNQAPWTLLQRVRQLIQVVGCLPQVLHRVVDLGVIRAHDRLHIRQQAPRFLQGVLQFCEVAGLVLLIEQPLRIGDRIDIGDTGGVVGRVGVRSTWVRTYDNEVIIVPNSDFTTPRIINWTVNDDRVRLAINVAVAHDSDPHRVADLLLEVARKHPAVLADPPPEALLADLTQSSLNFVLRFWTVIRADDNFRLKSDLRFLALSSLQEHGIATGASAGSMARASGA